MEMKKSSFRIKLCFSALFTFFIALLLFSEKNYAQAADGFVHYYALLIGSGGYNYERHPHDEEIAANDVRKVRNTLVDFGADWRIDKITCLINDQVSKVAIENSMNAIGQIMDGDDLFFFYYSGHGSNKGLALFDWNDFSPADLCSSLDTYIPQGAKSIVVLGCCYSGIFVSEFIKIGRSNTFILSACDYNQETPFVKFGFAKNSTFCNRFCAAIDGGADELAYGNKNREVSFDEAYSYVHFWMHIYGWDLPNNPFGLDPQRYPTSGTNSPAITREVAPSETIPTINLNSPAIDITVGAGDIVDISWGDSDSDDNATISLARDTDDSQAPWAIGEHCWLAGDALMIAEDQDGVGDHYLWNTSDVPPGTYIIWGMIYDGRHTERFSRAPGRVIIKQVANVDVALVIDRSGSMSGQKIADAKAAANTFVGFMQAGDKVAVVGFETAASVYYPLTTIVNDATKTQAQNAINNIIVGDLTTIGGGIQLGQIELDKGDPNHPHAMLLLTDGIQTADPRVNTILPTIPDKTDIYTIGLGTDADQALLNQIAVQTGGTYNFAPTSTDLQLIYQRIRGKIAGQSTLANYEGTISQGATQTHSVTLDALTSSAIFSMSFQGSDVDLELVTPSSKIINPQVASTDPNISFTEGSTYDFYNILAPEPGQWTMRIIGVNVLSPESYLASVQVSSRLTMDVFLDKDEYNTNDSILLSADLEEDGQSITGAMVTAEVTAPSYSTSAYQRAIGTHREEKEGQLLGDVGGSLYGESTFASGSADVGLLTFTSTSFTLYDDGMHGDGAASDGVYANFFNNTTNDGSYTFTIKASGSTSQSGVFMRESTISTYVKATTSSTEPLGLSGQTIYTIGLDPTDRNVIYVGTNGSGVYKSTNRGGSWSSMNTGIADLRIYRLIIDPSNSNTLYVGVGSKGIFKSTNGGSSWQSRSNGLPQTSVFSLLIDKTNTNVLYAGLFDNGGIYKTTNGGDQWFSANSGIDTNVEIHALAVHPSNSQIVFAGTHNGIFYKSTNGGNSWSQINVPGHNSYIFDIVFDPSNSNTMYIATNGHGVYKSTNSGNTWFQVNSGLGDMNIYELQIDPSGKLFAGTSSSGIYTSDDGGNNWSRYPDQGTFNTVHSMAFSSVEPNAFYVGTGSGIFRVNTSATSSVGTIHVITNVPQATYTISGPATYAGNSTSWTKTGVPPGNYTISYGSVTGYIAPPSETRTLTAGGTITFNGNYSVTGTVATPIFVPSPGTYTSPVSVIINCATSGATIRYTTDGSNPTESSQVYTSSIRINTTSTIKAKAYKSGWIPSIISEATYMITGMVATPTFDPPPGTYASPVNLVLSCATSGVTIRYTKDGNIPTESSPAYTTPIQINTTTTVTARAYKSQWTPSSAAVGIYTIRTETPIWQSMIAVNDGHGGTTTLTFGLATSASDGLDSQFNETELPPTPPSGIFDARFELPITPPVYSLVDFRSGTLTSANWLIKFQPGPSGYPLTFTWSNSSLPEGSFYLKDLVTGTVVNVDMKSQTSFVLTNSGITSFKIEYSQRMVKAVAVSAGWNIVSVPLLSNNMSKNGLFPSAISSAFAFDNGYVAKDNMENGKGYWLKFSTTENVQIAGRPVELARISHGSKKR
jgi:photosystem II stability/assembly factor-like uncharacterized protein/uncharacterized protein YegL